MRLKAVHLTMRVVDAISAEPMPTGERLVWDADVRGLGLRLRVSGGVLSRRWVFRYRFGGRQRFISIGEYAQHWTIELAREEAQRLRGLVASKKDPASEREATKATPTLEEAATEWVRGYAVHHKAPESVAGDKGMLARLEIAFIDVERNGRSVCDLGRTRVDSISQKQMERLHLKLKGTPTQANRAMALLSTIFSSVGRIGKDNPCRGVKRYREVGVERRLTPEEFARLGQVLSEVTEDESESPIIIGAIRILMLTGARPKEIKTARWDLLDEKAGTLRIPNPKEKKPKTIRLDPEALAIIRELPRGWKNPFIFAGRRGGEHITNLQDAWERIRLRAGIKDVRLYDLRHTYASTMMDLGLSAPQIGELLGHRVPATTQKYMHHLDGKNDPLRPAVNAGGAKITAMLKGEKT